MSRIGKLPVSIPSGVTVTVDGNAVKVKGPKGELMHKLPGGITVARDGHALNVKRASEETNHKSLHGLTRSLIANMVEGVTKGYQKQLEITGVGFKAEVRPYGLQLVARLLAHDRVQGADGHQADRAACRRRSSSTASDKALVGQVAAEIRGLRPPEPYKGKGIKYAGEIIRRKAGKAGGK